nr:40S ribosomal protein S8 [Hymenolepis microstoma]CDS34714.1 40S ribosomal protein S8 [Hymenolepis microstoma]
MGIARDRIHKRSKTGGRRERNRKKRKFELGRPAAMTKLGPKRIHSVRVRGGNIKLRAMRLDQGNFSWPSQAISRKSRIIDVVYNASNNELVRTKTLVKNAIVQIDSAPFRQWYEAHYLKELGRHQAKGGKKVEPVESPEEDVLLKKRSASAMKKFEARQKLPQANLSDHLKEQFMSGRLLACVSSRPGQVGRCDGYILEGKELDFYSRKLKAKKAK